jgi:hypothetical protein
MKFLRYTSNYEPCRVCEYCEEGATCQYPTAYKVGVFIDSDGEHLYRAVEPHTDTFFHKGKLIKHADLPWKY